MTLFELKELLEDLNIPIQYRTFKVCEAPPLPWILYYVIDNDPTLKADNSNYFKRSSVAIELYADEKDLALEERLEKILEDNFFEYDMAETYIESEFMYETIYEIII